MFALPHELRFKIWAFVRSEPIYQHLQARSNCLTDGPASVTAVLNLTNGRVLKVSRWLLTSMLSDHECSTLDEGGVIQERWVQRGGSWVHTHESSEHRPQRWRDACRQAHDS